MQTNNNRTEIEDKIFALKSRIDAISPQMRALIDEYMPLREEREECEAMIDRLEGELTKLDLRDAEEEEEIFITPKIMVTEAMLSKPKFGIFPSHKKADDEILYDDDSELLADHSSEPVGYENL